MRYSKCCCVVSTGVLMKNIFQVKISYIYNKNGHSSASVYINLIYFIINKNVYYCWLEHLHDTCPGKTHENSSIQRYYLSDSRIKWDEKALLNTHCSKMLSYSTYLKTFGLRTYK